MTDHIEFSTFSRVLWGMLGGFVAVGSKFLAQDWYWVRVYMDTHAYDRLPGLSLCYLILLIVLCTIGAVFAAASGENHRMKLLAIAVAAPAIITTWLGGATAASGIGPAVHAWERIFVTTAFAQTATGPTASGLSPFWQGFLTPLGYGKDEQRYRVVAGSFQSKADAEKKVAELKKQGFNATVGDPFLGNGYYSVLASDYLPYPEAAKVKDQVTKGLSINDAFLSPFVYH